MDEKPDQIEQHINQTRSRLGSNINELQRKLKSATDWRLQFQKHPMAMLSVAFGGGLALAAMIGRRSSYRGRDRDTGIPRRLRSDTADYSTGYSSTPSQVLREEKRKARETWDNIRAALIGFAAARAKQALNDYLPGFREHLERTEQEASRQRAVTQGSAQLGSTSYGAGSASQGSTQGSASQAASAYKPQTQPM